MYYIFMSNRYFHSKKKRFKNNLFKMLFHTKKTLKASISTKIKFWHSSSKGIIVKKEEIFDKVFTQNRALDIIFTRMYFLN